MDYAGLRQTIKGVSRRAADPAVWQAYIDHVAAVWIAEDEDVKAPEPSRGVDHNIASPYSVDSTIALIYAALHSMYACVVAKRRSPGVRFDAGATRAWEAMIATPAVGDFVGPHEDRHSRSGGTFRFESMEQSPQKFAARLKEHGIRWPAASSAFGTRDAPSWILSAYNLGAELGASPVIPHAVNVTPSGTAYVVFGCGVQGTGDEREQYVLADFHEGYADRHERKMLQGSELDEFLYDIRSPAALKPVAHLPPSFIPHAALRHFVNRRDTKAIRYGVAAMFGAEPLEVPVDVVKGVVVLDKGGIDPRGSALLAYMGVGVSGGLSYNIPMMLAIAATDGAMSSSIKAARSSGYAPRVPTETWVQHSWYLLRTVQETMDNQGFFAAVRVNDDTLRFSDREGHLIAVAVLNPDSGAWRVQRDAARVATGNWEGLVLALMKATGVRTMGDI